MTEVTTNQLWSIGSSQPMAQRGLSLYDLALFVGILGSYECLGGFFDLHWRLDGGILETDGQNDVFRPLGYGVNKREAEIDQLTKGNVQREC